ncbi:thioredoxin [Streptococcus pyogenes]|uniref:thioredoxin n=1 Tax=Streptococcus pyogenes TaxID=1314 RepID=UPI0021BFE6FF|nr:thioredoxin [Streptococcus pyogenes]
MKWRKKMALEVTDATFVEETKEGLVVIDFWATWCGPCRMQAPILEQLSQEIDEDELKILKMDVDENPETARQFGIMSIPTLMFKKDGEVVKQVAGVHTKDQLKAIIAELS